MISKNACKKRRYDSVQTVLYLPACVLCNSFLIIGIVFLYNLRFFIILFFIFIFLFIFLKKKKKKKKKLKKKTYIKKQTSQIDIKKRYGTKNANCTKNADTVRT